MFLPATFYLAIFSDMPLFLVWIGNTRKFNTPYTQMTSFIIFLCYFSKDLYKLRTCQWLEREKLGIYRIVHAHTSKESVNIKWTFTRSVKMLQKRQQHIFIVYAFNDNNQMQSIFFLAFSHFFLFLCHYYCS